MFFSRSRATNRPESLRQYAEADHTVLEGRYAGHVNFSKLPELKLRKGLEEFEKYGTGLGAIMLPMQPGLVNGNSDKERRHALNINVFRDKTTYEPGAYMLVPDRVLEQQSGRHRLGNDMPAAGIVQLRDGDVFPVGKKYWLPEVGRDVNMLQNNPRLAKLYAGVHGDQGAFHVRDGELLWIDSGFKNRSVLIQVPAQEIPEPQAAEQHFLATQKLDIGALAVKNIALGSVFDEPAPLPADIHDATGH